MYDHAYLGEDSLVDTTSGVLDTIKNLGAKVAPAITSVRQVTQAIRGVSATTTAPKVPAPPRPATSNVLMYAGIAAFLALATAGTVYFIRTRKKKNKQVRYHHV